VKAGESLFNEMLGVEVEDRAAKFLTRQGFVILPACRPRIPESDPIAAKSHC
jgi:Holliday junction resolvase-like predicted endonuclease